MLSKIKVIFSIITLISCFNIYYNYYNNYHNIANKSVAFSQVYATFLYIKICNVKVDSSTLSAPATHTSQTLNSATSTGKYLAILVQNIIFMELTLVNISLKYSDKSKPHCLFIDNRTLVKKGPTIRILLMTNERYYHKDKA